MEVQRTILNDSGAYIEHSDGSYQVASEIGAQSRLPLRDSEARSRVIITLQESLIEHGRKRAIDSGALEPQGEALRALEDLARASAKEQCSGPFDPTQNAHDRLREEEYKKLLADRRDAEQAEKYSTASLNECEEKVAQTRMFSAHPRASSSLTFSAVIVMAITVAPTLHDFIFVMSDDILSWGMALLTGGFIGTLITLMILADVHGQGQRTSINWVGLAAGVTMSLGLGILRLSRASDTGDVVFAIALSIVEAAIIIALEGVAIGLRAALRDWGTRRSDEMQAAHRLENARAKSKRYHDQIKEINDAIASHISYVEDRSIRYLRVEEIEAASVKAVIDGYNSGIADNQGRILGVGRRSL